MMNRGFVTHLEFGNVYFDFERMVYKYGITGNISLFVYSEEKDQLYGINNDNSIMKIFHDISETRNNFITKAFKDWIAEKIILGR